MAAAEKISVSLRPEDLAWARRQAKRELKSLSAVLSEAVRLRRQAEARALLLEDLGTGDITERERNEVRSEWRAAPVVRPVRGTRNRRRTTKK